MKKMMSKSLKACALAGALALTANLAFAQTSYLPFTVNEGSVAGTIPNIIANAGKITGNYNEVISFNDNGTFNVSLQWQAGQFVSTNGSTTISSQLSGIGPNSYGLYALYMGSGFVTLNADNSTTFNFTQGGSLSVFIDPNNDSTFTAKPVDGATAWAPGNSGDDYQIGYGIPLSGEGTLDPSLRTCGSNGINCGSFGAASTFALTDAGKLYFTAPDPFYGVSFQSGQLNNFTPSGRQEINGSLDVVFAVPEPAGVALIGLGLLGLGLARRRKSA